MPVDYSKYPANWFDEIRPDILKRDGYKCKFCRLPNRAIGYRDGSGQFIEADFFLQQWCKASNIKVFKIVLTIMHLDHNIQNNEYSNLAAGCQQCHNRYDAKNRAFRRSSKYKQA